jgi:hypothetical protein
MDRNEFFYANRMADLAEAWGGHVIGPGSTRAAVALAVRSDAVMARLVDQYGAEVLLVVSRGAVRCPHRAAVRVFDGHHVLQKSEGGPDCIENVWLICPNCHRNSHDLYRVWDHNGGLPADDFLVGTPLNQRFVKGVARRRWDVKKGLMLPCAG